MRQPQAGYVYEGRDGKGLHIRFYIYSEKGKRIQKSHKLCDKNENTPSKDSATVLQLASDFMQGVNEAVASERSGGGHSCPLCGNRCKRTVEQKFAPKQQEKEVLC
jgi:hypothetical protein